MKKISLMVSGLALGHQISGLCQACNYDYEWLIEKPSSLIYADKIIVPPHIYDTIKAGSPLGKDERLGKSIQKIFEVAENFDLIEIKSPNHVITKEVSQKISEEMKFDCNLLKQYFPKTIKAGKSSSVPGQIFIEKTEFCDARLWSIYASLYLAKKWNAESLFSDEVYTFCKYKFGLSNIVNQQSSITAFNKIFSTVIPENSIFTHYVFNNTAETSCTECKKLERCKKEYLSDIESRTHQYLELRDRDEIQQMKGVLNEIIGKVEKTKSVYSPQDIVDEFHSEELKIKRDLKKSFPKMERWSSLSLIASVPITLFGLASGSLQTAYAGQTINGVSSVIKEAMGYSKNKYRWVGFRSKQRKSK